MRRTAESPGLLDRFIPHAEIDECHETVVAAPASTVLEVASALDLHSVPGVREIFRLREKLLGGSSPPPDRPRGLVAETLSLGWGKLAERPDRELVLGAVTRPWLADVVFTALPSSGFAAFSTPGFVKIAWTLEAEPVGDARTRFRTRTRVHATDPEARRKFRRYWRKFGAGIVLIRWLMLFAVRKESERRFRRDRGG